MGRSATPSRSASTKIGRPVFREAQVSARKQLAPALAKRQENEMAILIAGLALARSAVVATPPTLSIERRPP